MTFSTSYGFLIFCSISNEIFLLTVASLLLHLLESFFFGFLYQCADLKGVSPLEKSAGAGSGYVPDF